MQHVYILKAGESSPPQGLQKAFKVGNRLQDILTSQFKTGKTGNEILKGALQQVKNEGIEGSSTHTLSATTGMPKALP